MIVNFKMLSQDTVMIGARTPTTGKCTLDFESDTLPYRPPWPRVFLGYKPRQANVDETIWTAPDRTRPRASSTDTGLQDLVLQKGVEKQNPPKTRIFSVFLKNQDIFV